MPGKLTMANMALETGAKNGIFQFNNLEAEFHALGVGE